MNQHLVYIEKYFVVLTNYVSFRKEYQAIILGIGAVVYLAFNISVRGGVSESIIVISALIMSIFFSSQYVIKKSDYLWVYMLGFYGAYSVFTVWYHHGDLSLYEIPSKFLLGCVVAYSILKIKIDFFYIKLGFILGTFTLAFLLYENYQGGSRFSANLNATKFSVAITIQAMLGFSLALIEKDLIQRIVFIVFSCFAIYCISLTGTRGSFITLFVYFLIVLLLYLKRISAIKLMAIFMISLLGLIALSNVPMVNDRYHSTITEIKKVTLGDYNTSIGYRLMMYKVGLQAGLKNPVFGDGYDYSKSFKDFESTSESQKATALSIGNTHRLFHNIYIDALVTKGFLGLIVLITLLGSAFCGCSRKNIILVLPPVTGIAISGLSDSTLDLGITVSYFILGTSILKSCNLFEKS